MTIDNLEIYVRGMDLVRSLKHRRQVLFALSLKAHITHGKSWKNSLGINYTLSHVESGLFKKQL